MKHASLVTYLALLQPVYGVKLVKSNTTISASPVPKVTQLIRELKARIEQDGVKEGKSYDKYACWCEETLGRKANGISEAKEQISDLEALIVKLKGEIAAHVSDIAQIKRDIAQNVESRRTATEVRDREFAGFNEEKLQSEQCAGALEAAVKVLADAGQKRGFLETAREAQLLSVVAGVRTVLARPEASRSVSKSDLQTVQHFVDQPEAFFGSQAGMSAAQIANNPFGDYAPQSTKIQGILKGMYETFIGDMERANAEEATAQKSFEALIATKLREAETLQTALDQQTADEAEKTMRVAESNTVLDTTKAQLDADEAFFVQTKTGCQAKASAWAERSRLRNEELAGINRAIEFLSSPEATKILEAAHTLFLQVESTAKDEPRRKAVASLRGAAAKTHNLGLAQLVLSLQSGGHFDKVIESIDSMLAMLRREEQADIEHRDRCQGAQTKNKNDLADLDHAVEKASTEMSRLQGEASRLDSDISTLEADIAATKKAMEDHLAMRTEEAADFRQAMKDDTDAVQILRNAIVALKEFYKRNNIKLSLLSAQGGNKEPTYTKDPDKAPETIWDGPKYGGRHEETTGVLAILEMVVEDLQKEMKTAVAEDAEAQALYEKERSALKATLDKQLALKLAKERELSDVNGEKLDTEEHKDAKTADKKAEELLQQSIYQDCSWVATHFESRRTKRKEEMDGLVEAKGYLAGVDSGEVI